MKLNHAFGFFFLGLIAVAPTTAFASIIGLLTPHRGNNITIRYKLLHDARPAVEITQQSGTGCPIQLYRYRDQKDELYKAYVAHAENDKDGIPYIGIPLWEERKCYLRDDDVEGKSERYKPNVQVVDLYEELFSHPVFEKYWKDFKKGAFKIGFVIQQPAGYETQQGITQLLSYTATKDGEAIFQTSYKKIEMYDLGLTDLKEVNPNLRFGQMTDPKLPDGMILTHPTTMLDISSFRLDPKDAFKSEPGNTFLNGGDGAMYYEFIFHRGQIVDSEHFPALARSGDTWCSLKLRVPKVKMSQNPIVVPGKSFDHLSCCSGGTAFSEAEEAKLGLKKYEYQRIFLEGYSGRMPSESETEVGVNCTGPGELQRSLRLQDIQDHLTYQGKTFTSFLSDLPALQKNGSNVEPVIIDPKNVVGHLSDDLKPIKEDTFVPMILRDSKHWQPGATVFRAKVNAMTLRAADAYSYEEARGFDKEIYQIHFMYAFKNGKPITKKQIVTEVAERRADFCTFNVRVVDHDPEPYSKILSVGQAVVKIDATHAHDLYFKEEAPTDRKQEMASSVLGGYMAIEGSELVIRNRNELPVGSVVIDHVTCYNSQTPDISIRSMKRHLNITGKPFLQDFLTNDMRFQ